MCDKTAGGRRILQLTYSIIITKNVFLAHTKKGNEHGNKPMATDMVS